MTQKQHQIIISLASNSNQEANLQAARSQLTQLLTEVHFTSAIWTEPVNCIRKEPYLNQLCRATTAFSMNLLNEVLKEAPITRMASWRSTSTYCNTTRSNTTCVTGAEVM